MHDIQAAANALTNGNLSTAQRVLDGVLKQSPREPNALQLMGLVHRRLGKLNDAVHYFRKSLSVSDPQPHVHNNLGITLAGLGQTAEAEKCYRRAIELDPEYPDAIYNLGLVQSARENWIEAKALLQKVVTLDPKNGRAFEALGIVLRETGELQSSLAAANTSVVLSPNSFTAHHNLGQAHMALGQFSAAAAAYQQAISLNANTDVSWIGLGHAFRAVARATESRVSYQRAVDLNPSNPDAHRLLNEMIWQTGDTTNYLQSFPLTLKHRTDDHRLRLAYANELLKTGQHEHATAELEIVLKTSAGNGDVLDAMARARSAAGDFNAARAFHARAMQSHPENSLTLRNFVETLLKSKQHQTAHEITTQGLQKFPLEQGILALHTTAQRLVGDQDYERLANFNGIAKVMQLEPPPGYSDIETFCAELKIFLETLHATKAHPTDQTLRGGTQSFGALFLNQTPILQQFIVQLRLAISKFISEIPEDGSHPFFSRAKPDFAFSGSWSVRLSSGGFHTNHFHPKGWISSAFYVDVPGAIAASGKHDGWLKMGETNLELGDHEIIHRFIEPKVGRLALFPSYFWHGTVPFESSTPRLTIAFDTIPK